MNKFKFFSLPGLAFLMLASTLPISCTTTPTTGVNTSTPSNSSLANKTSAVSGIIFSSRATDGRFVPPESNVNIDLMDEKGQKVIQSVRTDNLGRFYLKNIEIQDDKKEVGQRFTVRIQQANYNREVTILPGRIVNLSSIQVAGEEGAKQEARTISGILTDPKGEPLGAVEIRDKEFDFRKTTTDGAGRFTLDVVSQELEVILSSTPIPFPIAVSEFENSATVILDANNVRAIKGNVQDSTNSNVFLNGVKVKIAGTSISTITDSQGGFVLNGAPVGPFTLEVGNIKGYLDTTVQIAPSQFQAAPNQFKPVEIDQQPFQNIKIQPVGTIQVNFHVEDVADASYIQGDGTSVGCQAFNCRKFDLNGDGILNDVFHNSLGTLNTLDFTVNVRGTDITVKGEYPASTLLDVLGTDGLGEVKIFPAAVRSLNNVFSVLLENVPGGQQNITVSMTGMQTQKSLDVFVPPKDTISTELITLYRVKEAAGVGDVKGIISGVRPEDAGSIKINYVDISETNTYLPHIESNPILLSKIETALAENTSATLNPDGTYYLKNVPTGSRIMIVAGPDPTGDGKDSAGNDVAQDCYIPNSAVLLNVRSGVVNLSPDFRLTPRESTECLAG